MLSVHKVNAKKLTVVIHARGAGANRTLCGQAITHRDMLLSPWRCERQTEVTCPKCKKAAGR